MAWRFLDDSSPLRAGRRFSPPASWCRALRAGFTVCLGVALTAVTLYGCAEEEPKCPANFKPIVDDFEVDTQKLDKLAGCNNHWSPLVGNPCASDIPVIGAKKGFYYDADIEWLKAAVHNEYTNCTVQNPAGGCRVWYTSLWGCEWDWYSMCFCQKYTDAPEPTKQFCSEWYCLQKQVEHRTCWEADWDEAWSKTCGKPGEWPLQLTDDDFHDVLEAEGTGAVGNLSLDGTPMPALQALTIWKAGAQHFNFEDVCILREHPKDKNPPAGCKMDFGWRIMKPDFLTCECDGKSASGHYCSKTSCSSKSVLQDLINTGKTETRCLESTLAQDKCGVWETEEVGPEIAMYGQCKTCVLPNCNSHVCSKYPLQRIVEFKNQDHDNGMWGERFLYTIGHGSWIFIIAFFSLGIPLASIHESAQSSVCSYGCGLAGAVFAAFWIWIFAFCRFIDDQDLPLTRVGWQRPGDPFRGTLVHYVIAFTIAFLVVRIPWFDCPDERKRLGMRVLIALIWLPSCMYTMGLVPMLPVVGLFVCWMRKAWSRPYA